MTLMCYILVMYMCVRICIENLCFRICIKCHKNSHHSERISWICNNLCNHTHFHFSQHFESLKKSQAPLKILTNKKISIRITSMNSFLLTDFPTFPLNEKFEDLKFFNISPWFEYFFAIRIEGINDESCGFKNVCNLSFRFVIYDSKNSKWDVKFSAQNKLLKFDVSYLYNHVRMLTFITWMCCRSTPPSFLIFSMDKS